MSKISPFILSHPYVSYGVMVSRPDIPSNTIYKGVLAHTMIDKQKLWGDPNYWCVEPESFVFFTLSKDCYIKKNSLTYAFSVCIQENEFLVWRMILTHDNCPANTQNIYIFENQSYSKRESRKRLMYGPVLVYTLY